MLKLSYELIKDSLQNMLSEQVRDGVCLMPANISSPLCLAHMHLVTVCTRLQLAMQAFVPDRPVEFR